MSAARDRVGANARRLRRRIRGGIPSRRLQQYLARGFDSEYYLDANPDVRAAGVDPWTHFVEHGYAEGRSPRSSAPRSVVPVARRVTDPRRSRVSVYTSINLAYLDRALVLAESLRTHEPDWHRVVVLVEPELPTGGLAEALSAFDEVILAKDLYDERFESWVFGLNVVEACTAVKGAALVELLRRSDCDVVLYLDPDTWVLRKMDGVVDVLAEASGVLTPHVLSPATTDAAIWDGEVGSLKHGVFNLGFIGVRDCPEGRELAGWWAQRLYMACWDDPSRGLFTDQKWMNLAPVFFPSVRVLRDPGLNAASWNLNTRRIGRGAEGFLANDQPLTFFHFTKAETVGPAMTAMHAAGQGAVAQLWTEYMAELRATQARLPAIPEWGYSHYHDGSIILAADRRLAREGLLAPSGSLNPFGDRGSLVHRTVRRLRRRRMT